MKVNRHLSTWLTLQIIVGCFMVIPLLPLVPIAIAARYPRRRKMMRIASNFKCLNCGEILGKASIREGEDVDAWESRDAASRERPDVKTQNIHAVCTVCHARYPYLKKDRTFIPQVDVTDESLDERIRSQL